MQYYSERNSLRIQHKKTCDISLETYATLLQKCKDYYLNISYKYPERCQDGNACCGLNEVSLAVAILGEIPDLYQKHGRIETPGSISEFDQYSLLDFIEYMYENVYDYTTYRHRFYSHDHILKKNTRVDTDRFRKEINEIFERRGVLYALEKTGNVERIPEYNVVSDEIETLVAETKEDILRELLERAIQEFKSPYPENRKKSVETIWDAFERLKSYYIPNNKKQSIQKIVRVTAGDCQAFEKCIDEDFIALTSIGNDFLIRHSEMNKIAITDDRHYDYFFNRCLSAIALTLQYLDTEEFQERS